MSLINSRHPKIIGAEPKLSEDQVAVIDLLKEALAQALAGEISSIGIVCCMKNGYAHVMAGRQAADLYLGCASIQSEILGRVEGAGADMVARLNK